MWLYLEIMTKFEAIEKIIKKNGGYITRQDINKANIASAFLSEYVRKHELVRYASGFYAKPDWIRDDYFIFQYSYPKLIYSFYSAIYLHNLGDFIPPYLEVTGPKNYRPFKLPRSGVVLHTDTRESIYELGITSVKTSLGNVIKVYDIERTVCDFIRNREKLDSEVFIKCVNWYKKRQDKNVVNLINYARKMGIEDKVTNLMEVLLNEN